MNNSLSTVVLLCPFGRSLGRIELRFTDRGVAAIGPGGLSKHTCGCARTEFDYYGVYGSLLIVE